MKKLSLLAFSALCLSFLAMPSAFAVTLDAADNVVITKNILDDAYILAGNADIESEIFGDLYILGGSTTINSQIHEDLVVLGGRVVVVGDVSGDLRVIGGQVAVYGNVGDDVVVAGGQVDIGKSSIVGGSLVVGAGLLTVDGEIKEDIRGGLGMLILNGVVGKDVIVTIEDTMNISDKAKIKGDLKYSALLEANIPEGVVVGQTAFNKFERESVLETVTYLAFIRKGLSYISALILMLILVTFTPKYLLKSAKLTRENVFRSFGAGLLTVISVAVGSILLMITVVGVPIGLIALAALFIAVYVAKIFVAVWLAGYVLNYKKAISKKKLFWGASLALLAYYIVGMIPFVGWIINLALFFIGIGSICLMKIDYFKLMLKKGLL